MHWFRNTLVSVLVFVSLSMFYYVSDVMRDTVLQPELCTASLSEMWRAACLYASQEDIVDFCCN